MSGAPSPEQALLEPWRRAWPAALACWSRVVKLSEPRWCLEPAQEKKEGLTGSFAMIRLDDHAVVISLRQVAARRLSAYAPEVLAHEIGHHMLAPGDLADHARCLVRMRAALQDLAGKAAFIANLYTDLLINDRLQRVSELRMAEVYRALKAPDGGVLWALYMRIYENLWSLNPGDLGGSPAPEGADPAFELDAQLGARLVRHYSRDWLSGAGGFAALCYPYLKVDVDNQPAFSALMDASGVLGEDGAMPGGLAELDDEELNGAQHPRANPAVNGFPEEVLDDGDGTPPTEEGIKKPVPRPRPPADFRELMRSLGVKLSDEDIICQYYRELALPHLVPFPERVRHRASDPLPESLDQWDTGSPMEEIDWFESVLVSPVIVPGVTTVRRVYGTTEGSDPEKEPLDLYLGVDCSGSMTNPARGLSYPVVAGAVLALSALRAGASVMVVLSGEPGKYTSTDGFVRREQEVMRTLTAYLGTGYTFGIPRLAETFTDQARPRPAHILIVTDSDIYAMLDGKDGAVGTQTGWQVAKQARERAGGGGTMVLHGNLSHYEPKRQQLIADGWDVHNLSSQADLVAFARAFAARIYKQERTP